MKKLCHRTVTAGNYEPDQCIGKQCSMYGKIGGIQGCLEVTNLLLNSIEMINRQSQKQDEPKPVTPKKTVEKKDASKVDSRAGNILEGGDGPPAQDGDGGSSLPV
jgi:hypothetical protein